LVPARGGPEKDGRHGREKATVRLRPAARRPRAGGRRPGAHRARRLLRGRYAGRLGDVACRVHWRDAGLSAVRRCGRRRRTAKVPRNTVRRLLRGRHDIPGRHAAHIRRAARAPRHRPLWQPDGAHRLPVRVVRHAGGHHARPAAVQQLRLHHCR